MGFGFVGSVEAEKCFFCEQDHAIDIPCPNAGVYGERVCHLMSFIHAFDGLKLEDANVKRLFSVLKADRYDFMTVMQALNVIFNGREVDYSLVASPAFRIKGVQYNDVLDAINRMALCVTYRYDHPVRVYKDAYDAFVTALEKYIEGPSEERSGALFDILAPQVIVPDLYVVEYDGNYQMLYLVRLLACLPDNMRNQLINAVVASDPEGAKRIALQSPQGVYKEGAIELLCLYFKETHDPDGKMMEMLSNIKNELKNGEAEFLETGKAISSVLGDHGYWDKFSINCIGMLMSRE